MGANIRILEGGKGFVFDPVKKLKTNLQGSGSCLWVPESGVPLGTKTITKNGLYSAEDDNKFGYSSVTVNVQGKSIAGKDRTTGKYRAVVKDGDHLNVSSTPYEIRITTKPTKFQYRDGETINYSGMVVTAYDVDGTVWTSSKYPNGIIPNHELIKPETMASLSKVTLDNLWSSETGLCASKFHCYPDNDSIRNPWNKMGGFRSRTVIGYYDTTVYGEQYYVDMVIGNYTSTNHVEVITTIEQDIFATVYNDDLYLAFAGGTEFEYRCLGRVPDERWDYYYWRLMSSGYESDYSGDFVYYGNYGGYGEKKVDWFGVPESQIDPRGLNIELLGYDGPAEKIPIMWKRPGDEEILETSFLIVVLEAQS